MSEWIPWNDEQLEERLACWKPRPPSPRVERRLFGRDGSGVEVALPGWRWLAPALASCVMALVLIDPRSGHFRHWTAEGVSRLPVWDELPRIHAAYLAAETHSEQNSPATKTFEWTFGTASHSTMGFLPMAATNKLWH